MRNHDDAERIFPLLPILCIGSGCAALIYQVVWFQLLSLVIGASSVSLGVVLGTFMGGMCIGSLGIWRVVAARHDPLRVFAGIEIGIGVLGVLVLAGMPAVNAAYAALAPPGASGLGGLFLRATVAGVCLLPPTILMGATLPAIARFMQTTPLGVSRMGLCYAANIFGAVAGSLLAGFYLLRFHDVAVATWVAAGLNAAVGLGALALALRVPARAGAGAGAEAANNDAADRETTTGAASVAASAAAAPAHRSRAESEGDARRVPPGAAWPVYLTAALSGFTALAAEVVWTRHLSLLLGATVYTFALVLAVFLFGLGIGSGAGSALAHRTNPRAALGLSQLLLVVAVAWAAYTASRFLPYWPLDVTLPTASWVSMQLDLMRVLWVVLPAALLWGASFPLALAAAARGREQDPGRLMGGLYAANTLGAIAGALATSFVLIVAIGSRQTQQLLIVISLGAALTLLAPLAVERYAGRPLRLAATAAAAGVVALAALLAVPQLPGAFVSYGRFMPTRGAGADIVYLGEGLTASIAVSRQDDGTLTYHNAGKAQASTYPEDMRLQRMLGHLTTLVPENGRDYLVIGLGAGVTAGAVALDPNAERVVIADIEPLTRVAAGEYFREQNFGLLDDPDVELRIDDGRHFLLTTDETFDGITSDPLDPWVKGAAALYTREFWELVSSKLNPGGVVTVFVQLYEMTEDAVRSELASFFDVFPEGAIFMNTRAGEGYDAVLLARAGGAPIDVDMIHERLGRPEYARVARSLTEVGFQSATDLLGTYGGRGDELEPWLAGAVINTDRNLRLQYLAGTGLNLYRANQILRSMSATGPLSPDEFFVGSPELMRELDLIIRARQGRF